MQSFRASPVFSLVVLLTLALAAFIGVILVQPDWIAALAGPTTAGHIGQHFRDPHHRVHDLTFSLLLGTGVLGMLTQLRTPAKNGAGQLMALIPFIGLVLALALTNQAVLQLPWVSIGALTLIATVLRPTGRDLFRSVNFPRLNWVMLALVIIAAAPLLAFASANIGLQRAIADDHAALGHYGFMVAFSFTVIGVGLLASLRPAGWWLAAWVAGLLPALLGLTSMVVPSAESSLDLIWALVAIAWGVAFIAAAEIVRRSARGQTVHAGSVTDAGDAGVGPGRIPGNRTPMGVYVSAVIGLALVLLFAIMHLSGGGFGGLHAVR